MRLWMILGALHGVWPGMVNLHSEPSVELRGVAARVKVVPEARKDITVTVSHVNPLLPIRLHRLGDRLYITGNVGRDIHGCGDQAGRRVVSIWSRGVIPYDQLPEILIRTPLTVHMTVGDAVFGEIAKSSSVDFTNQGCGDWTIGDAQGALRINQVGSGAARAGGAGRADLSVIGAGNVAAGDVRGPLTAVSSGTGDIVVASAAATTDLRVGGSGSILINGGSAPTLSASIAGSGAVRFKGVVHSLRASIAGQGDITVSRVTGQVSKQVFGAGQVRIGP